MSKHRAGTDLQISGKWAIFPGKNWIFIKFYICRFSSDEIDDFFHPLFYILIPIFIVSKQYTTFNKTNSLVPVLVTGISIYCLIIFLNPKLKLCRDLLILIYYTLKYKPFLI